MHSLFTLPSLAGAMEEGTRKLLSSLAPAITHVFLHSITRYISNDKTSMDMRPQKPWITFFCFLVFSLHTRCTCHPHTTKHSACVHVCVIVVPLYLPYFPPFLNTFPPVTQSRSPHFSSHYPASPAFCGLPIVLAPRLLLYP